MKFRSLTTLTPADTDGNTDSGSGGIVSATSGDDTTSGDNATRIGTRSGGSGGTSQDTGRAGDTDAARDGNSTSDGGRGNSDSGDATTSGEFDEYTIDGVSSSDGVGARPTESGRDATPITGPAGRHFRKRCPCGKCTEWRRVSGVALQVENDTAPAPSRISFDTLRSKSKNLAKDTSKKMLGIGISTLYALPHMMLPVGTADHWPINDDEEKALVERVDAVLDMMPKRTKQRGLDAIAKIAPPIALIVTVAMITKPRLDLTRMLMSQRAKQARPNVPQPHTEEDSSVRPISTARSANPTTPANMPEGSSTGIDAGSLARRAAIIPPDSAALSDAAF